MAVLWLAVMWTSFTAYPGARELCSEHVAGTGMHITWTSYATKDGVAKVVTFYEKDQKRRAEKEEHGGFSLHAGANDADVITIFPAASADKFPHCRDAAASQDEKTLI